MYLSMYIKVEFKCKVKSDIFLFYSVCSMQKNVFCMEMCFCLETGSVCFFFVNCFPLLFFLLSWVLFDVSFIGLLDI